MKGSMFNLMSGKIGDTVAYVRGGKQFYRVRLRHFKNPKTACQMANRSRMYNLCAMYRALNGLIRYSFETRKGNQTAYNAFTSMNLQRVDCFLGREFRDNNACVAQPYMVSCGTMPSVAVEKAGKGFRSSLSLGGLVIDDRTTVGEFSRALISSNEGLLKRGDQLTYVSVAQDVTVERWRSHVLVRYYGVVLDEDSCMPLRAWLPELCSTSREGYLGTSDDVPAGGFCYIVSRRGRDGVLHVSTQVLVDAGMWDFSTEESLLAAVESYGVKDRAGEGLLGLRDKADEGLLRQFKASEGRLGQFRGGNAGVAGPFDGLMGHYGDDGVGLKWPYDGAIRPYADDNVGVKWPYSGLTRPYSDAIRPYNADDDVLGGGGFLLI